MNKKKVFKTVILISFFLIFTISITIMGIYIYKINADKNAEIQKSNELQSKVNTLNETVNELQKKLASISNIINSNTSQYNNVTNNLNTSENTKTKSISQNNSNEESIINKIIGTWKADKVLDFNGTDLGLNTIWGSGIKSSNKMIFKENGVFSYMIGITPTNNNGTFTVNGNIVKFSVPTNSNNTATWHTLTYIPEENILKEELDSNGEKQTIIYVKIND